MHQIDHSAPYPTTYFRELSPATLNYVATLHGALTVCLTGAFNYLELGCGMGLSTALHAAAYPEATFHACDNNPACIENLQQLQREGDLSNLVVHGAAIGELQGLPQFDFIVAHGVYSWVDAATRDEIRRIIRAHLKPGGLAYVSYNCMPGWAAEIPLRRFMHELAPAAEAITRTTGALTGLRRLSDAGLAYLHAHPAAREALAAYDASEPAYLAHEFMSPDWQCFYSIDIDGQMKDAGALFLGSATLVDNHRELLMPTALGDAIDLLETATARQLAMDFAVNRRFRRDVYIKTGRLAGDDPSPDDCLIGRMADIATLPQSITVPRGNITFGEDFIASLRSALRAGPKPLSQLIAEIAGMESRRLEVLRNLLFLVAAGELVPCARPIPPGFTSPGKITMNTLAHIRSSGRSGHIASRVAGAGILVSATEARQWLASLEAGDRREVPGRLEMLAPA